MNTNSYKGFIVTVPHAVPKDDAPPEEHWHDTIAEEMAGKIADHLPGDVIVIVADVNRCVRDYNRKKTRRSKWRRDLKNMVDSHPDYVLLDIHSFPPDHPDYGGSELTVLTNEWYIQPHEAAIIDYMNENGVTTYGIAEETSDIVAHYREMGRAPYMFEFNENLLPARKKQLASLISAYFS